MKASQKKNIIAWKSGSSLSVPLVSEDGSVFPVSLIPKSLLDKVEAILDLENRKRESRRVIASQNDNIKKIFDNQSRLRDNLKSLEKMPSSDLVKRYLKDMVIQENDLKSTRERIEELEIEDAKLDSHLKQAKFEVIDEARKEKESFSYPVGI